MVVVVITLFLTTTTLTKTKMSSRIQYDEERWPIYAKRIRSWFAESELYNNLSKYRSKYATDRRAEVMGRLVMSVNDEAGESLYDGGEWSRRRVVLPAGVPKHALIANSSEGDDVALFSSVCEELARKRKLEHHVHIVSTINHDRTRAVAYFWFADTS